VRRKHKHDPVHAGKRTMLATRGSRIALIDIKTLIIPCMVSKVSVLSKVKWPAKMIVDQSLHPTRVGTRMRLTHNNMRH
jgi:hypothetical protein